MKKYSYLLKTIVVSMLCIGVLSDRFQLLYNRDSCMGLDRVGQIWRLACFCQVSDEIKRSYILIYVPQNIKIRV